MSLSSNVCRTALCLSVGLALSSSGVQAQTIRSGSQVTGPLTLSQATINRGLTGQTFPGLSGSVSTPFLNPLVNPSVNPIVNPLWNLGTTSAINPGALNNFSNPAAALALNPLANPYAGLSASAFANPYAGLGSSLYGSAALGASQYGSISGGYGGAGSSGYGYSESDIGAYLRGTASLINADGQWMTSAEQARRTREQTRQARLENDKRAFEDALYRRNNTPTFEAERQVALKEDLQRSLNDPPQSEILSGRSLNTILADLAKLEKNQAGVTGPTIDLDADVVSHLNLTKGAGNPGLLKNAGRVFWPTALRNDDFKSEREQLSSLALEVVGGAVNGRVDAGSLKDMHETLDRLSQKLSDQVRTLPAGQYIEARRFLSDFADAQRILGRPDAGDCFSSRAWLPDKAKTAGDLARTLVASGFTIAPAVPGDESAYLAMHRALTAFDIGARAQLTANR